MKDAARDIRDFIVHIDVTDNVNRQTTSASTDSDNTSSYHYYLKSAVTEQEHLTDTLLPQDQKWNCKSTNADKDSNVLAPLPKMKETTVTSLNKLADSNNNNRVYNDSIANDSAADQLLCRIPASGKITPVRYKVQPHGMVTTSTQTTKATTHRPKTSRTVAVHEVTTTFFSHRAEVVCKMAMANDELFTAESDQSNYSGVYERDLDEILESTAKVNCHLHRRHRNPIAFQQHADKFYIRLMHSPEVQSHWASSDGCSGRSDSESELRWKWTSDDELDSDEDPTDAFDSGSFYRRLRFLLSGSRGPEMAVIEP